MEGLLDRRLPLIVNPAERCIRSGHSRLVQQCIEKLSAYFEDHNTLWKMIEIQYNYKYEEVEKLD